MTKSRRLSEAEIRERLSQVPGWELKDGKLQRALRFDDFRRAFGFMTSVALCAEAMNHHPEWSNVYNRVEVSLCTHDVDGISDKDFALAAEIDALYGP